VRARPSAAKPSTELADAAKHAHTANGADARILIPVLSAFPKVRTRYMTWRAIDPKDG